MSEPIVILVGTMSGTAALVADEMADALRSARREVQVQRMEKLTPQSLQAGTLYIVCTSTYGPGNVPDNAKALYSALQEQRPDLSAIRYGIFGLGDRLHHGPTFCNGAKRFDAILSELGAARIGEREEHDQRSGTYPEDHGRQWLERWLPLTAAK